MPGIARSRTGRTGAANSKPHSSLLPERAPLLQMMPDARRASSGASGTTRALPIHTRATSPCRALISSAYRRRRRASGAAPLALPRRHAAGLPQPWPCSSAGTPPVRLRPAPQRRCKAALGQHLLLSGNPGTTSWETEQPLSEAVTSLDTLVKRGCRVDASVLYNVLKRCMAQKNLSLGSRVHALSVECGLQANPFLANHIICMYAHHGRLDDAIHVFSKVPVPNRFMWASIILAHARHGRPAQAISLYAQMRRQRQRQRRRGSGGGVKPDSHVYVAVLKACGAAQDVLAGAQVHADIMEEETSGEEEGGSATTTSVHVGNALIDMYAKCGNLRDAQRVFDRLGSSRDVVTWNTMIGGYAERGCGREALALYARMKQEEGTSSLAADAFTFVSLLQACTADGALREGKQVHEQIRKQGLESNLLVGTGLVDMYAKLGNLATARSLFDSLPRRDVVTWNVMMAGYVQHGRGQEALTLYQRRMQEEGVMTTRAAADAATFVCLLQACAGAGNLRQGKQLHAQAQRLGLAGDVVIGTCLVDMYAKCGSLADAQTVFDRLPDKNVVTWTALIAGYAKHGLGRDALALHATMMQSAAGGGGGSPTTTNAVTFVCLLQACAGLGDLRRGRQLHAQVREQGMDADVAVANSLVDMYAKCGSLAGARRVFDAVPSKTVVTWNAMIAGYAAHGRCQDALALYRSMEQEEGVTPAADGVTFVCLLQACGSVAGLETGRAIHAHLVAAGLLLPLQAEESDAAGDDLVLPNAVIDMYAKCGSMGDAQRVFDALPRRDRVTWNALIAGYAHQGDSAAVFALFHRMMRGGGGVQPDGVTVLGVLTVCSHAGLVAHGVACFTTMASELGVQPTVEHYNCMVDLLGRAGHVHQAVAVARAMPPVSQCGAAADHNNNNVVAAWRSVLGACAKWKNVELGAQAFRCALRADATDASAYVLMANIYAAAGMQDEARKVRELRVRVQARKEPGRSWWTDGAGVVHTFGVGNDAQQQHPDPEWQRVDACVQLLLAKMNE